MKDCYSYTEHRLECTLPADHEGPHVVPVPTLSSVFKFEPGEPLQWADRATPEDEVIKAAFPTRSGRHDLYSEAMRLVGDRHSKGPLVSMVNWLLHRIETAEKGASDG